MIVVDSSSVISLALNCLTPVLKKLNMDFVVSPHVYEEIVARPKDSKRFSFESMRINILFEEGVMKVMECKTDLADRILAEANSTYLIQGKPLKIIHRAETEALALAGEYNADALLIDERTTRLLIEDPESLKDLLAHRNKSKVAMDVRRVAELKKIVPSIPVIRSTEMAAIAYERGFLRQYGGGEKKVLEAALCALKFSGCSISWDEIDEYMKVVI